MSQSSKSVGKLQQLKERKKKIIMSDEEYIAAGEEQRASTSATGAPAQPSSRGQGTPWGIPLPPPFQNDGRESFQLCVRRYEVIGLTEIIQDSTPVCKVSTSPKPPPVLPNNQTVF